MLSKTFLFYNAKFISAPQAIVFVLAIGVNHGKMLLLIISPVTPAIL